MRNLLLAATAIAALAVAAPAYALSPCLAGLGAGAVAGHYGHHTFIGAIGGCMTAKVLVSDWKRYKVAHPNASVSEFLDEKKQEMEGLLNAENGGNQ
jgi:hypothetical protein